MSAFITEFNAIQLRAHRINVANGWWDERRRMRACLISGGFSVKSADALFGIHLLGLAHTELSEGIEALRKADLPIDSLQPHSLVRELAGNIVRDMDMAEEMNLPLAEAIEEELACNATRGRMHGKNVA
tara:strand:- start:1361 stop:1747 length:387 start_codon:yes stop_codon:yes gene_type:complete